MDTARLPKSELCILIRRKPHPGDIALSSETHHLVSCRCTSANVRAITVVGNDNNEELHRTAATKTSAQRIYVFPDGADMSAATLWCDHHKGHA